MGFWYFLCTTLVLSCIYQINAIERIEEDETEFDTNDGSIKKFKVHIKEKSAVFNEKIYIDKKKNIEYFKVPPHNTLSETDNMYDFEMNITISRVKKERVCRISPLPKDLPRPDVLEKGLKQMSHSPPSHKIEKVVMQWRMGPKVDKSTLRKEVRDFCGDFPVYRLLPYTPDSMSVEGGRTKRNFKDFPLCDNQMPQCFPDTWIFTCRIRTDQCIYYVSCKLDAQNKMISCKNLARHLYHGLVCCKPRCPSG